MTIHLGGPEARALTAFCRRQLEWDPQAQARVMTANRALGVLTRPPLGVLVFAAVPTVDPIRTEDAVDAVTSLAMLADLLAAAGSDGIELNALPVERVRHSAPPRLDDLPPREGWQVPINGLAGDQVPSVDEATREFEARSPGLPPRRQEEVAEEIWSRTGFGGLPMRALHTARQLGMLADDSARISAAANGPWKRLSTPRGQVFVHATGPSARLTLHVVR